MTISKIRGFDIVTSNHSIERFQERNIKTETVIKSIKQISFEKYSNGLNLMIIDNAQGITIVLDVKTDVVVIVTVLNKTDVFIKKNTIVERIK